MERKFKRGDIYYANLNPVIGSEQGGTRPVLIISNDVGNKHSPTVIVAPITGMRLRILFILAMAICRKVMWHQAVSIC